MQLLCKDCGCQHVTTEARRDGTDLAPHTAQLNIAESILALRIKSLDDALSKAIQQMLTMQLKFAVLVRELQSTQAFLHLLRRYPSPTSYTCDKSAWAV